MKKLTLFNTLLVVLAIVSFQPVQAQWNLTGNSISSGNFLGTTNGFPIEFRTNSNPWLWLETNGGLSFNGGLGNTSTRPVIAAGTNMSEFRAQSVFGAAADDGFIRLSAGGGTGANTKSFIDLSGYSAVPDMDRNIVFGTNATERMRIDQNGYVGIGTTTPAYPLDLNGDMNFSAPLGAIIRQGGSQVFHSYGTDLMAGLDAGLNYTGSGGNTFLGYNAGINSIMGINNVYLGGISGRDSYGDANVFVGHSSGASNTTGDLNVFLGAGAGGPNLNGDANVCVGASAGLGNVDGLENMFLGTMSGTSNPSPIFLANALGYRSEVNSSNTMALGGINGTGYQVDVLIGYGTTAGYTLDVNGISRNTSGVWVTSDRRFKTNVKGITSALDKIRQLKPVSYDLIQDSYIEDAAGKKVKLNFIEGKQIGFIAQELEQVIPELVSTDSKGYKAVNYAQMVSVLTQGIKEQDAEITTLKEDKDKLASVVEELKARLDALEKGTVKPVVNTTAGDVTTTVQARLEQNNPNPFNENTTVKYFIPPHSGQAKIIIRSVNTAAEVMSFDITEKGNGHIVISGSSLPAGSYTCELYIDGRLSDTNKMILVK
ncbi:MAG: tail fiber domain-containing protein [Bacteroidota bacterium]